MDLSAISDLLFRPEPIVWVQRTIGLGHPWPFRVVDLLATSWGVLFAVGLALWAWGRGAAYSLIALLAIEAAINLLLNQLFSVPRPSAPEIVKYEQVNLGSFPSGHVFTATVIWGHFWRSRRIPFWLAALVVTGVGLGRLYLGVHYLADVVGGVVAGAMLVSLFPHLWRRLEPWLAGRRFRFYVALGGVVAAAAAGALWMMSGGSHFLWNTAGLTVGGAAALLLEARLLGDLASPPTSAAMAARIAIGVAGILPFLLADQATGESRFLVGAGAVAVAALWALLVAPALFNRMSGGEAAEPTSGEPRYST